MADARAPEDTTATPPDCLFCRLVAGEVPADVVVEGGRTLAFRDIDPQAPTHVLVVPREHHADVGALAAVDADLLAEVVRTAGEAAAVDGLTDHRLVFNTGPGAGQSVFHVHAHVLGGRRLAWPPG
ncbi:histidine triad nucleotide-binding protein [Vallicoccus soli]|uniref:Histidine triad nucleotide-binding protein n=1 Tax=Vallicoccus soli TaxID=2339232 RepID=A0A3A3ZLJ3_9ACTN|nr:histidine triad nucleotide-binding protein [Vallicoccus soli]RJK97042.1 histidine triad nucleotide-binding protein [Vallicoccus soli]